MATNGTMRAQSTPSRSASPSTRDGEEPVSNQASSARQWRAACATGPPWPRWASRFNVTGDLRSVRMPVDSRARISRIQGPDRGVGGQGGGAAGWEIDDRRGVVAAERHAGGREHGGRCQPWAMNERVGEAREFGHPPTYVGAL